MKISATKKVEIGVNSFHFMRVVLFRCFFSFSLPKETDLTVEMFLSSSWFWFFMSMIGLSRCFEYFFWCFRSKWGFKLKNLKSYFSSDLWLLNSTKANDVSFVVVADASPTHVIRPFKKLKKNKDSRALAPFGFFFYFIFGLKKLIKTNRWTQLSPWVGS